MSSVEEEADLEVPAIVAIPRPPEAPRVRRSGIAEAIAVSDGLSMLSQKFGKLHGRELSPDGLAALMFLSHNGSPDLCEEIIEKKQYMGSVRELGNFTKEVSAANAHLQIIEATAKAQQARV